MALTRRYLSTLGLESEKIDEIIEAHTESLNGIKAERDDLKAKIDSLSAVEKENEKLKAQIDASGDKDSRLEALQKEFDDYKKDIESKETLRAKESAYRKLLKDAGVIDKRIDSIIKVTDIKSLEVDKDGNFKDADTLKTNIATEWGDFIVKSSTNGANTPNPPQNVGGNTKTKEEIMAIKDGTERRKAMAENPSLFGIEIAKE